MNIGSKLILSFLLVTLLPTALLAVLTTTIISNSKKEDRQEALNNNLKAAWMQYYTRAYQMQYGMLQASTEDYMKQAIVRRDRSLLRRQMKVWKRHRPYVDLWAIVDDRGLTIASLMTARSGVPMPLNGLVQKAVKKKTSLMSTEVIPYETLKGESIAAEASVNVVAQHGVESSGWRIKDRLMSLYEIIGYGDAVVAPESAGVAGKDAHPVTGTLRYGMMLVVATPVMDDRGSVIGVIVTGDLLNNDPFIPDSLADSIPGTLSAITMGNVQIATNVVSETGERTIGRIIPEQVIRDTNAGGGFRGEVLIANRYYLTAFDPIINNEGNVIGSLFVGVPKDKFVELQYENIKVIATIALVGFMLATGVASFITYRITRPIKTLTRKAQLISAGNLDINPGVQKGGNDEIYDLSRTFDTMVKSLRDNEERILVSQDKLRQQKNLIESIINSLPYCLYVIERNLGIVVWNRHAAQACPICKCASVEDCYNLNLIAHLPNDELKRGLDAVINRVFETGEPFQTEQKVVPRGGKEITLRTSIFPILFDRGGTVNYVVWMAEDITKKKEMEASVISSEKLAAIGQLAAGMAHEVNNPLGGILNCLYNLKKKKLTEARKAEYLDFMEDGIKRVQNIVRQLLDFSQQHAPELRLTDINGMIDGITPLFLHSIKGRDVRLITNLGQGLPSIRVDKHQIEQILVNLILNAIQSVDGDGVIEVATRYEGQWYCIAVSDNGCGIPAENLPKIFDPFFTTKGVGKGTGLGLSVSRGIIERHKGRIDVESEVGMGTVFKVYLPIAS